MNVAVYVHGNGLIGCATCFKCSLKRRSDRAPVWLFMQALFGCQKTCAQCAAEIAACVCVFVQPSVYTEKGGDDASACRLVSLSCRYPSCCCCIPQPSGNDTSRMRMMDLSCKSSGAWKHSTYSEHHLLWFSPIWNQWNRNYY